MFGNVFAVVLLGGICGIQAWKYNQHYWQTDGNFTVDEPLILTSRILVGLFQLVSFVFIAVATVRIRKYIVSKNMADELNAKMMFLHVFSFSFYIISGTVFYIAEINYYETDVSDPVKKKNATQQLMMILCFSNISCFLAQIC